MPSTGPSASKKQQEVPKLSPQEIAILTRKAKDIRAEKVATQGPKGYQDIGEGYSVKFLPKDTAADPPRNTDYFNITGPGIGTPPCRGVDAFEKLLEGQVGKKRPSEQPAAVRRRPTPRCRTPLSPPSPSFPCPHVLMQSDSSKQPAQPAAKKLKPSPDAPPAAPQPSKAPAAPPPAAPPPAALQSSGSTSSVLDVADELGEVSRLTRIKGTSSANSLHFTWIAPEISGKFWVLLYEKFDGKTIPDR